MADFSNARFWDPSVSEGARKDDGPIGLGSAFAIVARFAGRDVPLTYAIVAYEPPVKVVLEARRGFVSRDTITVEEAAGGGSLVHYDAVLAFSGIARARRSAHAARLRPRGREGEGGTRDGSQPLTLAVRPAGARRPHRSGPGVATSAGSAPCRSRG